MIRFSNRVPRRLAPNRLTEARAGLGSVPLDLTISNPTLCGLPYPDDLLAPLADPVGLEYRPDPRGPLPARVAIDSAPARTRAMIVVHPGFFFDLPYESSMVLSLLTPEVQWRGGVRAILGVIGDAL